MLGAEEIITHIRNGPYTQVYNLVGSYILVKQCMSWDMWIAVLVDTEE